MSLQPDMELGFTPEWIDTVLFALDVGREYILRTHQEPDGDMYTHDLANAVMRQDASRVESLTALLLIYMERDKLVTPQQSAILWQGWHNHYPGRKRPQYVCPDSGR